MSAPDPREAEIAALRDELAELRARLARLEAFVGLDRDQAEAAPPADDVFSDPFGPAGGPAIEPSEPWGLKPPGHGER